MTEQDKKLSAAPAIILVRPQMGENIGATARAMANFGLHDLRIVSPRDGWPNQKALDMASHAAHLVESARVFADVPSALADLTFVAACSARPRDMEKPSANPAEIARDLHARAGQGIGLLFGSERTGLENEELILADCIVTIPTTANASLNLAQAVVVLAYAWFSETAPATDTAPKPMAEKSAIDTFLNSFEARLDEANFWRVPEKKERMWLYLRQMILRMGPDSQDIQTLHGVLRSLSGLKPR